MEVRCAIVGAGPSGLASARWALAFGVQPVVFEASHSIGGLWCYKEEVDEYASVMKSTTFNTSKETSAFSDFPPPEDFPNYTRHDQYLEYLRLYAEHHELNRHIRLKHKVLRVKPAEEYCESGRWSVQYQDSNGNVQEAEFDYVLLATGHNNVPNFPASGEEWWPGQKQFQGSILHSKQYKHSRGFEDTVCVVVGCGNSALDAACDVSRVARKVYLSSRKGAYVVSRLSDYGRPFDLSLLSRFRAYYLSRIVPKWTIGWMLGRQWNRHFDHGLYGIAPEGPVLESQISINDDLPSQILTGRIIVKPAIKEFTATGIVYTDGTVTDAVDVVVLATGYKKCIRIFEAGTVKVMDGNFARLYKNIYPVDETCLRHNTLGFIGMVQTFGSINISEIQARFFFHQLQSRSPETPRGLLPSDQDMIAEVEDRRKTLGSRIHRFSLWVDYIPYMDSLAEVIGCKPNLRQLLLADPMLSKTLVLGPNAAYVYRLCGPHRWEGARDAILGVEHRVRQAFQPRQSKTAQKGKPVANFTIALPLALFILSALLMRLF